jgi:polyhydroxyalkanoate synthase
MAPVRTADTRPLAEFLQTVAVRRNLDRVRRGMNVLLSRDPPPVGATPRDVVYAKGTFRLYRYRPLTDEVYRIPVVLVMSLVSKPYILDLSPGQSLVEYLLREGFDVFMLDWGIPRPEDKRLGLEYYVLESLPRNIEEVQKVTGEREVSLLGYCMGGLFTLMYSGIFHDAPVANIVCAATPVDFEGMPLFRRWSDPRWFDVDRLVDRLGNIPPDLILRSFEMLRPVERWISYIRLSDNLWNDLWVKNYRLSYRWVNDHAPFPGEAYRQMIKELLWENKLMKGTLTIGGHRVDTTAITCPLIHIMAQHDHIAPYASAQPLTSIVGSEDKEDLVLKGGHVSLVAGQNAWFRLWPKLSEWLSVRSV